MAAISGLVEVVLTVLDIEKSLAFYRDTLGLELISPPNLPARFLRVGPVVGGIPRQIVLVPAPPGQQLAKNKRLHHIGLEVAPADFDAERRRLQTLGFEIRGGTHPFMPVEAFYLDDPDGNEIEIATWRG